MTDLKSMLTLMEKTVLEASSLLLDRSRAREIRQKGKGDFVTAVDTAVQSFIARTLEKACPGIQFMGEEGEKNRPDPGRPMWILDPVDGTANLIRDMGMSVISLALVSEGRPQAGVIYQPYTRELFSGARGLGARCSGAPISVSTARKPEEGIFGLGTCPYYPRLGDWSFSAARRIFDRSMDIRRSGSAAMDLAYVAAGRLEGMFEAILQPWDVAAGILLIEEAGGTVTDFRGNPVELLGPGSIAASNGLLHRFLLETLPPFDPDTCQ